MSTPWDISIAGSSGGPVRLAGVATGEPAGGSQPMNLTNPVVIPFDHPDLATGVDLGFVGSSASYAIAVLFDVTETFDDAALRLYDQNDQQIGVGELYNNPMSLDVLGPGSDPIASYMGNISTSTLAVLLKRTGGAPTQGSVTVRVLYADVS